MKNINILLVDDHKLIRDGIKSIINTTYNINVINECCNGQEVVDYLKVNPETVDVILMDINMPKLNGIETTKIITKLYPDIRVLALTMHVEEAYIMKMIEAGALGYLLKDAGREKLIEAIKTVYRKEKCYSNNVAQKLINAFLHKENTPTTPGLSPREIQVITSITNGNTNKEIAEELYISSRTVESHRRNIIKKLNLKNTVELVNYVVRNGLVS
jgi:two-component system, NarL family, nitrate/nitrite response regulator NarL